MDNSKFSWWSWPETISKDGEGHPAVVSSTSENGSSEKLNGFFWESFLSFFSVQFENVSNFNSKLHLISKIQLIFDPSCSCFSHQLPIPTTSQVGNRVLSGEGLSGGQQGTWSFWWSTLKRAAFAPHLGGENDAIWLGMYGILWEIPY